MANKKYERKFNCRIKLIDKCILLFLAVLFIQSILGVLVVEMNNDQTQLIDIVIRTTIASIFGYLVSSNFIKTEVSNSERVVSDTTYSVQPKPIPLNDETPTSPTESPIGKIGFTAEIQSDEVSMGAATVVNTNTIQTIDYTFPSKLQIIIITTIGLLSLIVLLIVRNLNLIRTETVATISQLRDIVCGSVGFLLGCPSSSEDSQKLN